MSSLKIAVIGGGSTYTPELIEGFLLADLPVREIALMDIDGQKLGIVGGLARRMTEAMESPISVTLTADRGAALDGADVVITQLRVGGMPARILDERIPLKYNLVGQETTGPGGFSKALRTIPVILDINREMAARCPDAWLINFANPSGLNMEAVRLHGRGKYVGLCNYPLTLKMKAAKALGVDASRLKLAYFGLNHLSWTRVLVDGVDRTRELIEVMIDTPEFREINGYAFSSSLLRRLELIPSGYLRFYYDREKMVKELKAAPKTRGEQVRDIEDQLLTCYALPSICEKPSELQERGGAWYSTAAVQLTRDLWSEKGGTHILNVPNGTAMTILPPNVIVEVPCHVGKGKIASMPNLVFDRERPRVAGHPIAPEIEKLIARVKAYELRTVSAAVTGSREEAQAALALHPLLDGHHDVIPALLEDLLNAHREFLPAFF